MDFEIDADTFELAADVMRNARVKTSNEDKLRLYALFKQVECGPCKSAKPAFYDLMGRAKWGAWKKLGEMNKDEAMENYIGIAERLVPKQQWTNIKQTDKGETGGSSGLGAVVISRLVSENEEPILRDDEKTVFDWCKEGNVSQLVGLLNEDPNIVHSIDDQGLGLLHWACDRGHVEVVQLLLERKANVNETDPEGQTPLHYGCCCDFEQVTRILLLAGADVNLRDSDGNLPLDVASSSEVKQLVSQGFPLC